jgi:hypothetical protein
LGGEAFRRLVPKTKSFCCKIEIDRDWARTIAQVVEHLPSKQEAERQVLLTYKSVLLPGAISMLVQ